MSEASNSETTPLWMISKNCGVYTREIATILKDSGLEIQVDHDGKPCIRKSDLLMQIKKA